MNAFPTYGLEVDDDYLRDVDGRLIRAERAAHDELARMVTLLVDGQRVEVPQATPWVDDQGLIRIDVEGQPIPRRTTLYDAIAKRYTPGRDESNPVPRTDNPVPVLCHQEHLVPVAACRVCSVLLSRSGRAEARLVPACKYLVQPDQEIQEVHTSRSREPVCIAGREPEAAGAYVARTVRQIVRLLALDHLHDSPGDDRPYHNELLAVAEHVRLSPPAPPAPDAPPGRDLVSHLPKPRGTDPALFDDSSPVIRFDRTSCILCDRCVRSCHDVKPFRVISHTGRGHGTRISFDFGKAIGASSCVSCGECAISCPTGALSFRGTVYEGRDPWSDQAVKPVTVKARRLRKHPLFAGIPLAFLKWNEGAVGRRRLKDGDVLCNRGEFGTSAFVIERGTLEVDRGPGMNVIERTARDVIVGEMGCMNNNARSATVRAKGPARVLIIRRNMLHMFRRNKISREILDHSYAERALEDWMIGGTLFGGFPEEERRGHVEFLRSRPKMDVKYVRVDPKQVIINKGERAACVYFLCEGHVEVSEATRSAEKRVRDYLGPGRSFGEIGVMSELSDAIASKLAGGPRGRHTGTCTALDHVALISVSRDAIQAMLNSERFPTLRAELERRCLDLIDENSGFPYPENVDLREEFTALGLHEGQNLLVIDLEKCTRCLECVRACADSHGGVTRLVFEWERFDRFLIPATCRSCHDPLCLTGCPVDAIHRRPSRPDRSSQPTLAVFIEDHCIGCGICAQNCPFDSIQMHDIEAPSGDEPRRVGFPSRIATNCDLCESGNLGGIPRCVYACPHDAARRESGDHLMGALELGLRGRNGPTLTLPPGTASCGSPRTTSR
jgi:Fe-S-cluster-containing hydrogenase component 2/CRP-like cAMP-binding protein